MKKAILGALFAGAMLASCSNDDSIINGGDPFDGEQAFVKVKIAMADDAGRGTRAVTDGGYVNGSEAENNVYTVGFKFYGADGSFYGYGETIENPTVEREGTDGNVEAKIAAVVALKINEGAPKPTKVVAYVNCSDWKNEGNEPSLSDISATTTVINGTKNGVTSTTNFAMTSSNYGTAGYATTVPATSFKETESEAKADNTAVEIYVERLAAKVQVSKADDIDEAELTKGDYKLTFVMDGWNLGGINNSSYLIKNLDASWATTAPWTGWDATSDFRCFWAKDVNYPATYSIPAATEPQLTYKSWTAGHTNKNALYCCENTFPARGESTVNRYKVQPFVYVMGHYTVTKNNSTVTDAYLYNYADGIYPESAMIANMQNASGTIVYKQNAEDNTKYDGQSLAGKVEIVSYTYKEGTNTITDASRVMLQLKSGADLKDLLIKNPNATATEKYIAATETNVNEALAKTPVIAYGFKYDATAGGYLAYFPVLIEHLNYNSTEGATQEVGAYGIVRNHVYNLTITEIKNLGIGVFNPDVDIIPDEKAKTLYLGAKINILSWKWVNQTVKL